MSLLQRFNYVLKPGSGQDAAGSPVLVLLHGTGGDEHEILPLGERLLPGATLLSIRGQESESGMPRFFRRFAPGVFDVQNAIERASELAEFLTAARAELNLAGRDLVAVGYSNGANIAHGVLLRHPGVLAGAILLRPMVVAPPPDAGDPNEPKVLLLSGGQDPTVPAGQAEALATRLRGIGAVVKHTAQQAGHGLTHGDLRAGAEWLTKWRAE